MTDTDLRVEKMRDIILKCTDADTNDANFAAHQILSILDNETKATRSDEARLREALEDARRFIWNEKHRDNADDPVDVCDHCEMVRQIDAALNPPGVE